MSRTPAQDCFGFISSWQRFSQTWCSLICWLRLWVIPLRESPRAKSSIPCKRELSCMRIIFMQSSSIPNLLSIVIFTLSHQLKIVRSQDRAIGQVVSVFWKSKSNWPVIAWKPLWVSKPPQSDKKWMKWLTRLTFCRVVSRKSMISCGEFP